jgi:hypothetical protein
MKRCPEKKRSTSARSVAMFCPRKMLLFRAGTLRVHQLMFTVRDACMQFEDSKSEQYRYVFATGVFGGVNSNDGQMIFYLDRFEPETVSTPRPGAQKLTKITRELQVEVHMTACMHE